MSATAPWADAHFRHGFDPEPYPRLVFDDPIPGGAGWEDAPVLDAFAHEFPAGLEPFAPSFPAHEGELGAQNGLEGMSPYPLLLGLTLFSSLGGIAPANGRKLKEKYFWKQIDFTYQTQQDRIDAIISGKYIPPHNLPLGLDVWNGRTFVTLPKWRSGVAATLGVIPKNSSSSPLIQPYPNWNWHVEGNCNGLTSVFRISIDQCGRLWVLDSGVIDVLTSAKQLCPPQIVVFDLRTDKLLWRYRIPKDQVPEGALFTNIVTDVGTGKCEETFAYVADVLRYGIVVYDWKEDRSWRVSHNFFYPDPLSCKYNLDNITFRWTDGIFGMSLSPVDPETGDRNLYFHPMSSFREFVVPTSILRNNSADDHSDEFKVLGEARALANGHSSASGMDRRGILFYNLVTNNAVGCWNSKNPHKRVYQGIADQSKETLSFPNDLKVDQEKKQSVWVLSNKLHKYVYASLNTEEVNFRILTGKVDDLIRDTVCDPNSDYVPEPEITPECSYQEL